MSIPAVIVVTIMRKAIKYRRQPIAFLSMSPSSRILDDRIILSENGFVGSDGIAASSSSSIEVSLSKVLEPSSFCIVSGNIIVSIVLIVDILPDGRPIFWFL